MEEMLAKIERRNTEIKSLKDKLSNLSEEKNKKDNENTIHIDQLKKLIEHLRSKNDNLEFQLKGGKGKKRPAELSDEFHAMRTPSKKTPLKTSPRKAFQ